MNDAPYNKDGKIHAASPSDATLEAQLTKGIDFYDPHEFAGGIPQVMATLPQIRIGKRRFTTAQILTVLVPLGFIAGLCMVAVAQQLRTYPEVQGVHSKVSGHGEFLAPY